MKLVIGICILILLTLVVYPLFYLGINSVTIDGNLSLNNYIEIFRHSQYMSAFLNTILLGLLVTFIASCLGIYLGWAAARTNMPWKPFIRNFSFIPFVIP